jgi:hypothetical protein
MIAIPIPSSYFKASYIISNILLYKDFNSVYFVADSDTVIPRLKDYFSFRYSVTALSNW